MLSQKFIPSDMAQHLEVHDVRAVYIPFYHFHLVITTTFKTEVAMPSGARVTSDSECEPRCTHPV